MKQLKKEVKCLDWYEYQEKNRLAIERFLKQWNIPTGKLVRPNITLLICESLEGDTNKALELGCAIEIAHYTSLIADDFIDQDKERRGLPTDWITSASNMLLKVIRNISYPYSIVSKYGRKYVLEVAKTQKKMTEGVAKELFSNLPASALYNAVITNKTASLFAISAKFGAMSSKYEEDDSAISLWNDYGLRLGRVFQIADDIGDMKQILEGSRTVNRLSSEFILLKCITIDHTLIEMLGKYLLSGNLDINYLKTVFDDEQTQKALQKFLNKEKRATKSIFDKINKKYELKEEFIEILKTLPDELSKIKMEGR